MHAEGARNADLQYDPLGRLWRVSGGAAGATRFYYDGDKLVFEMSDGGALRHFYVHGDGVDQPLVWWDFTGANTRRFLHADQQGSIVAVSNGQTGGLVMVGTVPAINSYDPWGVPGQNNMPGLRFGYTGQAWIPELGMYYYKARFYWPMLGRFLQTDPIGYDDQVNLYAYVANDPANATDPDGEEEESIVVKGRRAVEGVSRLLNTPLIPRVRIDLPRPIIRAAEAVGISEKCMESTSIEDCTAADEFAAGSMVLPGGLVLKAGRLVAGGGLILRRAAAGRGMFGLGSASPRSAHVLGRVWVGRGARPMSSGKGWISADGLRQFRFPALKAKLGKVQANFESRSGSSGRWMNNGHLDIH